MKKLFLLFLLVVASTLVQGQDTIHLQAPTPCLSSSIIEHHMESYLQCFIFPNPTDGVFHLQIKAAETLGRVNLLVTTLQGATVYQTQFYSSGIELHTSVNLSNLSNGYYILTLSNKEGMVTEKLILQK